MAENIFNHTAHELGLQISAESAGISTLGGERMSNYSLSVLKEIGINADNHISKKFVPAFIDQYDLFIGMTPTHNYILKQAGIPEDKIYQFSQEITDPYGGSLEDYILCRNNLIQEINKLIEMAVG